MQKQHIKLHPDQLKKCKKIDKEEFAFPSNCVLELRSRSYPQTQTDTHTHTHIHTHVRARARICFFVCATFSSTYATAQLEGDYCVQLASRSLTQSSFFPSTVIPAGSMLFELCVSITCCAHEILNKLFFFFFFFNCSRKFASVYVDVFVNLSVCVSGLSQPMHVNKITS